MDDLIVALDAVVVGNRDLHVVVVDKGCMELGPGYSPWHLDRLDSSDIDTEDLYQCLEVCWRTLVLRELVTGHMMSV